MTIRTDDDAEAEEIGSNAKGGEGGKGFEVLPVVTVILLPVAFALAFALVAVAAVVRFMVSNVKIVISLFNPCISCFLMVPKVFFFQLRHATTGRDLLSPNKIGIKNEPT
jgi:hypothetical protein